MTDILKSLIGKQISLVCFGEYVCFVHIGDNDHIRFEGETNLIGGVIANRQLFPEPTGGVLKAIIGKTVESARAEKSEGFALSLEGGLTLRTPAIEGYESVLVSAQGQTLII